MVKRRGGSRFTPEPFQIRPVADELLGEHLQRDSSIQPLLLRLVDGAHPALADLADQDVVAKPHFLREIGLDCHTDSLASKWQFANIS